MKSNIYLFLLLGAFVIFTSFSNAPQPLQNAFDKCKIYIPNAFSPNDDGVNDTFQAFLGCPVNSFDIKVFNRWGRLVFSSQNPDDGWDGEFNGQPADANVYVYVLKVTYDVEGQIEEETKTGDVALVR